MTSGLLRGCRQVPNWASWGGRSDPYAIKWLSLGSATDYYSKPATSHSPDSVVTMWVKATDILVNGTNYGLYGVYDGTSGADIFSLELAGDTTLGNTVELFIGNTLLGSTHIGVNWVNITIRWISGATELWVNGVIVSNSPVSYSGVITHHTIGVTNRPPPTAVNYLDMCIVDEIAYFDVPLDPVVIYNSGVPLQYSDTYPNLIASYEVEKSTGSITAYYIFPTYYPAALPASFSWGSASLAGKVEVTTDAMRSSDNNPLADMATKYGDWVYGVTSIALPRTPLGSGIDMTAVACGLMPYPAGGGFSTIGYTGAFIGNKDEPDATPHMSKTTTMASGDSTAYAASGGTDSLTGVTDARAGRLFLPRFVKR